MLCRVGADSRLSSQWLDICSRLSTSPPDASLRSPSATQHHHSSRRHPRQPAAASGSDVQILDKNRTAHERSPAFEVGSPQVLPALRRLLLRPLVGPGKTQSVHGALIEKSLSMSAATLDAADGLPTLKREPKFKQEVGVSRHSGNVVRDRFKTTSGFRVTPEVHETRPPRKRRLPNMCAYIKSDNFSGSDAGKSTGSTDISSNGDCLAGNGISSEPEVEICPSDLSSTPPDITVDRSLKQEVMSRKEGVADFIAHAPRKRFRYEFFSRIDNQVTAGASGVDAGQTGSGNDVINLTTSTKGGSGCGGTRDVAVQCVLTSKKDGGEADLEGLDFSDPRHPFYRNLTCGCQTSAGNLVSFYCWYCGIAFDDDVLHAIHMGCHSVADKFVCNVCGVACGDRYGFNSHLVRGHIQATASVSEKPPSGPVLPLQLPSTARLVTQTTSLPPSSLSTIYS